MQLSFRDDALMLLLQECKFVKCPDVCFCCEEAFSASICTRAGTFTNDLSRIV
jgi:hypothetical protein